MVPELIPFALGSAVYPTLLAAVMVMLGRPNPKRLVAGFLLGSMAMSLTVGFVIVALLRSGHVVSGSGSNDAVGPAIDIVLGALILTLLVVMLTGGRADRIAARRRHRREEKEAAGKDPWSRRVFEGGSVKLAILAGVVLNLPGALYLVALKDIAASDASTELVVVQVVLYNVIMFQWAEIPLLGYSFAPERTQAILGRFYKWLGRNARTLAIVLCTVAGGFLLVRGLIDAL